MNALHARPAQRSSSRRGTAAAARPAVLAIAVAASCAAWADEPSPYYIGVSETLTHDSNVYRIPGGTGDYYSNTSLNGGFDQQVSRQRFYADANVAYNKYRNATLLDNTSYGLRAGWDWATIEKLSGNLGVDAAQQLASDNGGRPTTTKNIVKTDQVSATARWGGEGLLGLVGSYAHSRVRYSDPASLTSQSSADVASLGGSYRLGADLRAGVAYRYTRTKTPYATAITPTPVGPDDYSPNTANGRNIDLTLDWRSTAQTNVNTRLSWTRMTNSDSTRQDFSGLTGAIAANYAPTAKLTFNASISRDAGAYSSFFNVPAGAPTTGGTTVSNPGATPGSAQTSLSENTQTTDSVLLGMGYAATAKISLNLSYQYLHGKVVTVVAGSNVESDDDSRIARLGASYAIARNWQLGCNVAHYTHTLTGTNGYSYSANTVGCTAQFTLR